MKHWDGVRPAQKFGPRAMQLPLFGDMNFRSDGVSEDCLYLNVWTPARSGKQKLPVLVYFYGGGFVAGDGSEPRYDGESMAKKGIVAVTVNYRLGLFGFFAHPDLTRRSPHHASGNYGLLDQHAALEWVKRNIAAFGGDPRRVTIAGESAVPFRFPRRWRRHCRKVCLRRQMAKAVHHRGAFSCSAGRCRSEGCQAGVRSGHRPIAFTRCAAQDPAEELLQTAAKAGGMWFSPTMDGYFLPEDPAQIFSAAKQMHVPLLAGVNSEESGYSAVLGRAQPTVENYRAALERLYPGKGDDVFKLYPAASETEVKDAAQALASDRFISHSTWTWMDLATKTGGCPTYYYLYDHPRPPMRPEMGNVVPGLAGGVITNSQPRARQQPQSRGAVHSAEIEYALGNLASNKVFAWTPEDFKISNLMQDYFANFIKTANPNGPGLTKWPEFSTGERLVIDASPRPEKVNQLRARYKLLDQLAEKK